MSKSVFESKGFKKILAMAYGLGAAIVIVGALFKIMHWKGADEMLILGMGTEAIIFTISAFEPVHQEPDWTLVYPELAGLEPKEKGGKKGSVSQQLDQMLEEAKVGPELIGSLGNGLKSLSQNVSQLTDLSSAAVATNEYTNSVQKATKSIDGISTSYDKAVESINAMASSSEGSREYAEQVKAITKNLSALNSVYELEIAESNNHIKQINNFVGSLSKVVNNLAETEDNANQFKVEIDKLNRNLGSLNSIYGNMLSAMNAPRVS